MSNLPDHIDEGRNRLALRLPTLATIGVLALAFYGGGAAIIAGGGAGGPAAVEGTPDQPGTPVLDVAVLEGDSTVTLSTSAFVGAGSDAQASTSWWIVSLANAGYDTVWSSLEDADSLDHYSPAGITGGAGLVADSTHRAFVIHTGTEGGDSEPDSVEFVATSASVDWHCNWDYAAGDSLAAVMGRATGSSNSYSECFKTNNGSYVAGLVSVVTRAAAEAVGCYFPAGGDGNVLKVTFNRNTPGGPTVHADSIGASTAAQNVAAITVGSTAYVRLYHCNDFDAGESVNQHGPNIGYGGNGNLCSGANGCYLMWNVFSQISATDSSYWMETEQKPNSTGGLGAGKFGPGAGVLHPGKSRAYLVNRTYRTELAYTRETTDSVRARARLYEYTAGVGETLLADQTDFECSSEQVGTCGAASDPEPRMGEHLFLASSGETDRMLTAVEIGNNGTTDNDPTTDQSIYYYGYAFKVSADSTSFIGAYPIGPEAN